MSNAPKPFPYAIVGVIIASVAPFLYSPVGSVVWKNAVRMYFPCSSLEERIRYFTRKPQSPNPSFTAGLVFALDAGGSPQKNFTPPSGKRPHSFFPPPILLRTPPVVLLPHNIHPLPLSSTLRV